MSPKRKAPSKLSSPSKSKSQKQKAPEPPTLLQPSITHRTTGLSSPSTDVDEDHNQWQIRKKNAETRIEDYVHIGDKTRTNEDIPGQSLRVLLDWLLPGGRDHHARKILEAKSDEEIWIHFWDVYRFLAAPMKTSTRYSSSFTSSTKSAHQSAVASTLTEPQKHLKGFPELLLQRDNHGCVVTSDVNIDFFQKSNPDDVGNATTEGAHIIPYAYANWNTPVEYTDKKG
ncbi:hypothetical protein N7463_005811 [Penicillium fimorum]|uniref:HNH nuclease domain-containing protein n=1 Tax=Penicillium fimorum TaxID=1882269 RepID=A0A9W9XT56_9EURO|nr:hypothetical protein N7463_005811 [Penicillium fimorum]